MSKTLRSPTLISLLIITPLGFASKFYIGPAAWWFNNYAGGVFYEIFWCLVVILLLPYTSAFLIASFVLVITCFLEFLQLWHPPFLETIRSTFIGSALIGTTFTWWDFPHYVIGCFIGWILIRLTKSKEKNG